MDDLSHDANPETGERDPTAKELTRMPHVALISARVEVGLLAATKNILARSVGKHRALVVLLRSTLYLLAREIAVLLVTVQDLLVQECDILARGAHIAECHHTNQRIKTSWNDLSMLLVTTDETVL